MRDCRLPGFQVRRRVPGAQGAALDILVSTVGFIGLWAARRFLIRTDGPAGDAGADREKA